MEGTPKILWVMQDKSDNHAGSILIYLVLFFDSNRPPCHDH